MEPQVSEVIKLSHTHQAIMAFMVENPEVPLDKVAAKFGYTQGWLSQLIHSSLFQAELHYKQDVHFGEAALSVKDRITEAAHQSLARINERVQSGVVSTDTLVDIAEMALKNLGYGAPKAAPQAVINNNTYVNQPVDRTILAEARATMQQRAPLTLEHQPHEPTSPVDRGEYRHDDRLPESREPQETPDGDRARGPQRPAHAGAVASVGFASFGAVRREATEA